MSLPSMASHSLRMATSVTMRQLAARNGLNVARTRPISISMSMNAYSSPFASKNFQQRTLFGGASRNLLSHVEETANRNPNSATAQNAFYQALLRANMPAIIVERVQMGSFASNAACEAAYQKAQNMMGQTGSMARNYEQMGNQGVNDNQMASIGQAVAAQHQGGNMATVTQTGNSKGSPVHVIVDETIGRKIFMWIRMFLYFGLFTYISLIIVSMMVETLQSFKKIGGKMDNEAKAEHQKIKFDDVHGCDEAKDELQELVEFLKDPTKFSTLGGKLPKGVLLVGPPGTGKTLLARAVAGESGVPFFFMSGSEFDEVYVGVGAKRVRDLFAAAKSKSPAIIFIDELDAIGGKRNAKDAAYVKQTLNQLLTELDGFEQNSGIVIIAATNFPEMLDKALTRPGRFDRNVVVGLPDVRGRMAILKHHMKKIITAADVNLETLAQGTPGFSGAELENLLNQAAVRASRAKATAVSMLDMEWAKDKVMMGAERKSMIMSQEEREMTAYHEAGHALCCLFTPGADQLHKVTILPRGNALGITHFMPAMDKYSMYFGEFKARLDIAMGGKVAEELIYGPEKVSSGCSSDLSNATQIAYHMVTQSGMSEKLGNVDLRSNYEALSNTTKQTVEAEVRRLIDESKNRATSLLVEKRKELDLLAKALVAYETLDRVECEKVIRGEDLPDRIKVPAGDMKVPIPLGPPPSMPDIPGSKGDQVEPADKPGVTHPRWRDE